MALPSEAEQKPCARQHKNHLLALQTGDLRSLPGFDMSCRAWAIGDRPRSTTHIKSGWTVIKRGSRGLPWRGLGCPQIITLETVLISSSFPEKGKRNFCEALLASASEWPLSVQWCYI